MEAPATETPRRILIIEDCRVTAQGMRLVLETSGHQIAVAHTGESGLKLAAEFHPDVIFCDIGLSPGMDGFTVARALRDQGAPAHLIALTGHAGEDDRRRAKEAGFDLLLAKPLEPRTLGPLLAQLPQV
jgi:CheY-like chemotaxis protein